MTRKGFIVLLVAAIWAAAIWFAVEGYYRHSAPSAEDIRRGATGWYSLRRAPGYTGPVAQVQRDDDGTSLDIGTVNDMRQFCAHTTCVVRTMYDQSGNGAHMHKVD